MCMLCLSEFTITWRRHHCRSCGRVICSQCSDNKAPLRYMKYQPARVCDECYETLKEDMKNDLRKSQGDSGAGRPSISEDDSSTSVSDSVGEERADAGEIAEGAAGKKDDGGLSLTGLMSRFQKIRFSKDKRKANNYRPSVLKEVHANDEGSDMSGYLNIYKSRKWKKLWFVVKGKVLYTYKASEDMAAIESMPLLGYEVTRFNTWFEGAEPSLLFELTHQNTQPLTRKNGEALSAKVIPGTEKTTQRLIFRTDTAVATSKWVTVLREASLA
ncbi:FYVE, RhoGEF and PH domain-containing protein 6 [Aplysia californica]|uniref:FYVE, RhoGEF and PH domain-containing protein 6 n=1 Tax=Aplysia californica TaxID=6500 RepID=A0ABM0JKP0_APLCA|nr:FYVE, RhoGEF and PH domain-containing protein 6 [Aplysia californica]